MVRTRSSELKAWLLTTRQPPRSNSKQTLTSGTVGAVRVMRVEYDHYSKMCRSNKIPPMAIKDAATYVEQVSHGPP